MYKRRINTLKFIITVVIVYAILASNLFGIGQKIAPSPKDYVNEPDSQSVTQLEKIYLQDDETYEA